MRKSKQMKQILEILTKNPDKAFTLYGIAKELGITKDVLSRDSAIRVSLSRCLNTLKRKGLIDYEHFDFRTEHNPDQVLKTPKTDRKKYWFIKIKNQ